MTSVQVYFAYLLRSNDCDSFFFAADYVLEGQDGTPYEGGYYHGKIIFPPQYPFKPPSILMLTPSGGTLEDCLAPGVSRARRPELTRAPRAQDASP